MLRLFGVGGWVAGTHPPPRVRPSRACRKRCRGCSPAGCAASHPPAALRRARLWLGATS